MSRSMVNEVLLKTLSLLHEDYIMGSVKCNVLYDKCWI